MRIRTPANAYFGPDGTNPSSSIPIIADYSITLDVNSDIASGLIDLFTPTDGVYIAVLFVKTNAVATTGTTNIQWQQMATSAGIFGDLTSTGRAGANSDFQEPFFMQVDGPLQISYAVTGFSGGPANFSAYWKFYKVAG